MPFRLDVVLARVPETNFLFSIIGVPILTAYRHPAFPIGELESVQRFCLSLTENQAGPWGAGRGIRPIHPKAEINRQGTLGILDSCPVYSVRPCWNNLSLYRTGARGKRQPRHQPQENRRTPFLHSRFFPDGCFPRFRITQPAALSGLVPHVFFMVSHGAFRQHNVPAPLVPRQKASIPTCPDPLSGC